MSQTETSEPTLRRCLGPVSAIMITVGSVIGSGIFLKPLDIAKSLPSTTWIYAAWAGLGLVCLFGAFAYAELGAMMPEAGGQYAFLRAGYGPFVAFMYGWVLLLVINSGTTAALAVAFAAQLGAFCGLPPSAEVPIACAMILVLAGANHFGVGFGAWVQNLSTFAKLGALGAIVAGGILFSHPAAPVAVTAPERDLVSGLVAAAVAIFWAYEGWYQLPFSAAELRRPERDLPLGLIWGMVILIVTYVAVNAIYLYFVPLDEMRTLKLDVDVPRLALQRCFGPASGNWLSLLICLSVFGSANPAFLSTPRAIYAMAKDGAVPPIFMGIHRRYRTPTFAIWSQAVWAIVLLAVLKSFRDITDYVVFISLICYGLTVGAVYVMRRRRPDAARPYRCFAYPIGPLIFIAVVLFVDVRMLFDEESRTNALIGLGIVATGVPVWIWRPWKVRAKAP